MAGHGGSGALNILGPVTCRSVRECCGNEARWTQLAVRVRFVQEGGVDDLVNVFNNFEASHDEFDD